MRVPIIGELCLDQVSTTVHAPIICANVLGYSQNHHAVAGGYVVDALGYKGCAPTRYRVVVLTVSKSGSEF